VEMPQPVEGPRILTFQLVDGMLRLDYFGRVCPDRWPRAARKVYLLAFTNVLKTAGVAVLGHRDEQGASREAADGQEIDQMVVTWADWVAAWEIDNDVSSNTIWRHIPLL